MTKGVYGKKRPLGDAIRGEKKGIKEVWDLITHNQ
jgi:hypothetical protein